MADVGRVADLRHLAVADEVDPRVDLVLDPLLDGRADHALVLGAIDVLALVLGPDLVDDVLGARKAADMRGQDP
jgi:hypothetical protein